MAAFGSAVNAGHIDPNQNASLIAVIGTLGTADTSGTSLTIPVGADPLTGAMYVNNIGTAGGGAAGTNVNVVTGTQQTLGTVANLNNGSVIIQSGTITTGTLQNLVTGTILNSGTTTGVGVVTALTSGSVTMQVGTLTTGTLQNLVSGTINALAAGTITGGTIGNINAGTTQRSSIPVQIGTSFVTVGTTGAGVWGTLIAASGAGTKQYVARSSIVVTSGTVDVAITNVGIGGSTGAGVLERGQFPAGGGITNNYDPVIVSGTNGTLSYWLGGAGTVAITINYWQGV